MRWSAGMKIAPTSRPRTNSPSACSLQASTNIPATIPGGFAAAGDGSEKSPKRRFHWSPGRNLSGGRCKPRIWPGDTYSVDGTRRATCVTRGTDSGGRPEAVSAPRRTTMHGRPSPAGRAQHAETVANTPQSRPASFSRRFGKVENCVKTGDFMDAKLDLAKTRDRARGT